MTLLEQSLCILPGVSPEAEIRLRRSGVLTCRQLSQEADGHFSVAHAVRIRESFAQFELAARFGLVEWFAGQLPVGHRVRVLRDFMDDAVYYDIETDGMARGSRITCITTLRGGRLRSFVRGRDLNSFLEEWANAKILVGFNSKRFDTPMVCREFGLAAVPAQIDLMDEAAQYGLRGGLKSIEKQVGFKRKASSCASGVDAIDFWHRFHDEGDEDALASLLAYNQNDVLSLRHLVNHLLRLSLENAMIFEN